MSIIAGYLNQVGEKRKTSEFVFYDGLAVNPIPFNDDAVGATFKVRGIKTGGQAVSNTVTIEGYLGVTFKSETLSFTTTGPQTKNGTNTYDRLTSVTTTLHTEDPVPTIRLIALDTYGAPLSATTWEEFMCRWEDKTVPYWTPGGAFTLSNGKVMTEAAISVGDTIRLQSVGGSGHEVVQVKPATGLGGSEEFRTVLI
jgi:hypothetical protein